MFRGTPLECGQGLCLHGELDVTTVDDLARMLDTFADATGDVTLDLAELTFMDVSGLRAFEQFAGELAGGLVLEHVSENIHRVFEITGVDRNPAIHLHGARPTEHA